MESRRFRAKCIVFCDVLDHNLSNLSEAWPQCAKEEEKLPAKFVIKGPWPVSIYHVAGHKGRASRSTTRRRKKSSDTAALKPFSVEQCVLHKKWTWVIEAWYLRISKMYMGTLGIDVYFHSVNLSFLVVFSTKIGRQCPGFPFTFWASLGIM